MSESIKTEQKTHRGPINFRVGGRLADELTRLALIEENSVAAVARRILAAGLERTDGSNQAA